jgi:hypothetical protein
MAHKIKLLGAVLVATVVAAVVLISLRHITPSVGPLPQGTTKHLQEGSQESVVRLLTEVKPPGVHIEQGTDRSASPQELLTPKADFRKPIAELVASKNKYPSFELLSALSTNDEALLVELYEKESELTNRMAFTWALAAIGGDVGAHSLIRTLNADYGGATLRIRAWEVLRDTMDVLGYLSARSDSAFSFLQEAKSPTFWSKTRKWHKQHPRDEAFEDRRFAGLAIHALGISGRGEVGPVLDEFRRQEPEVVFDYTGAVASGAFYYEVATTRGQSVLLKYQLSGRTYDEYEAWTKTESGQEWKSWSFSVKTRKTSN